MRREEFMTELASLLQDISAEERIEAMQYYNDYFDDAGEAQEENIVKQLGSPAKVAAEVKAGLNPQEDDTAEYRETGYTDNEKKPWTNKTLKIVLIVLVVLVAIPILGPVVMGIVSAIFGIIIAIISIFVALVVAASAVAIAGVGIVVAGGVTVFTNVASGLLVTGIGLILTVVGVIATVAAVKLCTVVFPGIIRGIAYLGRKIFHRDKVVA